MRRESRGTVGRQAMKIETLGAHGGEMPGCRSTSFRIDGRLAVDAGGLVASLSIEEQCRLDHVLITHPHLDHVKDLALMSDLVVGRREGPVQVHATPGVLAALRRHVFNNVIWPDFTAIPSRSNPVLSFNEICPLQEYSAGKHALRAIPVNHTVEAVGFVVSGLGATVAFSGDTGPTELFWQELNRLPRLDALFIELSFPNCLQDVADASLHLTPRTLDQELRKLNRTDLSVFLYHIKPAFFPLLEKEVDDLRRSNLRILHDGDVITIRPTGVSVRWAGTAPTPTSRVAAAR
jgi:cAMP phosphodiesterase